MQAGLITVALINALCLRCEALASRPAKPCYPETHRPGPHVPVDIARLNWAGRCGIVPSAPMVNNL
jgi:hypothetical protein